MLGLGVPWALAVLGAISAAHHGWPFFFGELCSKEGVCIVRRTLRRISMKHQKQIVTAHNRGLSCTSAYLSICINKRLKCVGVVIIVVFVDVVVVASVYRKYIR